MSDYIINEHRIKKEISNKKFGYQFASIFLIIFFIRFLLFKSVNTFDYVILSLFLIFFLLSLFKANYIVPVKTFWLKFSIYLAKILNPIILFIIYLICFVPIGIYYKLINKKNLNTTIDKKSKTYWEEPEEKKINFEDQF